MMHQIATRGVLYPCDPKHLAEMTVHSNNGAVYTTSLIDSTLYLLYEVRRFFFVTRPPHENTAPVGWRNKWGRLLKKNVSGVLFYEVVCSHNTLNNN